MGPILMELLAFILGTDDKGIHIYAYYGSICIEFSAYLPLIEVQLCVITTSPAVCASRTATGHGQPVVCFPHYFCGK